VLVIWPVRSFLSLTRHNPRYPGPPSIKATFNNLEDRHGTLMGELSGIH